MFWTSRTNSARVCLVQRRDWDNFYTAKKFLLSSWTATMAALIVWFRYCAWCIRGPRSIPMIVQFKLSAIRQTRGYEYLLKFVLGGGR